MKTFVKRFLLFVTPLLVYVLLALYIDPYNVIFKENNKKIIQLEHSIPYKLNYPLYKLQQYSDNPLDVILLGDSRTDNLNTATFVNLTNLGTANLAYGSGSLDEVIKTFWYATTKHAFKEVYIGVNFNIYNADNNMNRVDDAIILKESPISYLFSQYCFKSTFLIIQSLLTNRQVDLEKPNFNKSGFWKYQLQTSASNFYRNYKYPKQYFKQLKEISNYCVNNKIKLVFFCPPTHLDLQLKVKEFGLVKEEQTFKKDIAALGVFYDFDYPNEITTNRDNFKDPFHYNDSIANLVIKEIVTGNIKFAIKHTP